MTAEIKLLETLDIFEGVDHEDLEVIGELLKPMGVREGEVLTRRGDPAQNFYISLSGSYMIYFKDGRAFTLHEKGSVIGMSTMLEPFNYRGTTVALTDGEVLMVAGDKFNELIQGNARLGGKIMRTLNDVVAHRMPFFSDSHNKSEEKTESADH